MRRLALVAACALCFSPLAAIAAETVPQLTVTGEGQAAAVPDMATVSVGVTAQNENPSAAMDQASQIAAAILARLDALGIDARDRQTSDVGLQPVWEDYNSGRERKIVGYQANNMLTVRVRDLAKLGDVLGSVTADGANRLSGLSFGLQDPDPVIEEARRDAVADAMARAKVYAEAAGVTLGPVLSIDEAGGGSMPMPMAEMARVASSVPIAAGESALSARVTMVFQLGE